MPKPVAHCLFFGPVSPSDVLNFSKKLKPKISCGHDNISCKLLKETIEIVIEPITHIINQSLTKGIVPSEMKLAKVIPIHKSSDQSILKNYRPVSLLPAFSKVLEKIVYSKLMNFLNMYDLLYMLHCSFHALHDLSHHSPS